MAHSPGRRLFVSRDPSVLERVRTGLTSDGAPPSAPSGTALDSTSALGRVSLSVLGLAVERLQSGPAGAVDDLQELYAAGLPAGLLHLSTLRPRYDPYFAQTVAPQPFPRVVQASHVHGRFTGGSHTLRPTSGLELSANHQLMHRIDNRLRRTQLRKSC